MSDRPYVVVVSGYEGIEDIFGPFDACEALAFHNEMKEDVVREWDTTYDYAPPVWAWAIPGDMEALSHFRSNIREEIANSKYGTPFFDIPEDPDRVCIMKASRANESMTCCCDEFPGRIPNSKTWWR